MKEGMKEGTKEKEGRKEAKGRSDRLKVTS
jgi:hypothetical protein